MMAASRMPSVSPGPDENEIMFFAAPRQGSGFRAQSLPSLQTTVDEASDGQQVPRSFLRRPRSPVASLSSIGRGMGDGGVSNSSSFQNAPREYPRERSIQSGSHFFTNRVRWPVSSSPAGLNRSVEGSGDLNREPPSSVSRGLGGGRDTETPQVNLPEAQLDATSQSASEVPTTPRLEPNLESSSEEPELSNDKPAVSTFVIFAPSTLLNDPTAIRPNDVSLLENFVPDGGNSCDIHRSAEAENWIEHHYDASLLKSIRSAGLGGPLATMLSPETPALAIFGSMLDNRVLDLAQALCEASNLVVMVRPPSDDPVTIFLRQSLATDKMPGAKMHHAEDTDDEMDGESFSSSSNQSDDDREYEDLPTQGVFRLRGGATRRERDLQQADDPNYISPRLGIKRPDYGAHRTDVHLHLHLNENTVYDVGIIPRTTFKFQTLEDEIPHALTDPVTRPQILSSVDLKVRMRPAEVHLDRSYSNIGFIAQKPNFITDQEYLPRGFERPAAKATHTRQKSRQTTRAVSVGFADGKPTLTGTALSSHTVGEMEELADEKPLPLCYVKEQIGKYWNSQTQSYSSYDLVWHATADGDGTPHPLKIRFGMGIELNGKEERFLPKLPRISHILRNQIILWVNDPTLKAKARGMIVLTTTYLPDIRVPDPIYITEDKDVDLAIAQPHDPQPLDTTRLPHDSANSVAIGLLPRKKTARTGVRKFMHDTVFKSFRSKSKKPVLVDLPLHEYVARGWDETNKQWRNTVWPTLDEQFRDVPLSSAAWNLTVQPGSQGAGDSAQGTAGQITGEAVAGVNTAPTVGSSRRAALPVADSSATDSGSTSTTFGSQSGGIMVGLPTDSASEGPKYKPGVVGANI